MAIKTYNPLICALDTPNLADAISLVNLIKNHIGHVKIGLELFIAHGLHVVEKISNMGVSIFLDLKLHDIPNTVKRSIAVLSDMNVQMITVHTTGGKAMLDAAMEYSNNIKIIGVTTLTSLDSSDIYMEPTIPDLGLYLTKKAVYSKLNGIVCSANEVDVIKKQYNITTIVPGIRIDANIDDHKRSMSPKMALAKGADYLVLGRAITNAMNPIKTLEEIIADCGIKTSNNS